MGFPNSFRTSFIKLHQVACLGRKAAQKNGLSTARQAHSEAFLLWARQGLNLRPIDYESTALTAELRALSVLLKEKLRTRTTESEIRRFPEIALKEVEQTRKEALLYKISM
jgi:hypothetical protein